MSDFTKIGVRFFTCSECRSPSVQKGFDQKVLETQCKYCRRQAGSYNEVEELYDALRAPAQILTQTK